MPLFVSSIWVAVVFAAMSGYHWNVLDKTSFKRQFGGRYMKMGSSDAGKTKDILDSQLIEELVEIDADGNVHVVGSAPMTRGGKPTVLHDPKGDY